MPSFLSSNRFRNIFAPPVTPYDDQYTGVNFGPTDLAQRPQLPIIPQDDFDPTARMNELYKPSTSAGQSFDELINQYPQRENPSILRRLGSMLVDYTKGPQAGQAMMDQPFTDKLTDWKNKIGPAQANANLERQENMNDRSMAYQTMSLELRDRAADAKSRNDEVKAKIAQQRADVYQFKAEHPEFKFDYTGPKVKVVDPRTGKITVTQWDTGHMTETDKIHTNQENAIARIEATGEQARKTQGDKQEDTKNNIELRGWGQPVMIDDPDNPGNQIAVSINQITSEVKRITAPGGKGVGPIVKPSSTGGAKAEQPTQTKVRQFLAAQQLMSTRPDLAPFIKLDTSNNFSIMPSTEATYFSKKKGPTPAQRKEINDIIYGTVAPVASRGATNTPMTKTQTNVKTGEKRTVVSTDGGKTWHPQVQ